MPAVSVVCIIVLKIQGLIDFFFSGSLSGSASFVQILETVCCYEGTSNQKMHNSSSSFSLCVGNRVTCSRHLFCVFLWSRMTKGFYMCNLISIPQGNRKWLKAPSDCEQHTHTHACLLVHLFAFIF